MYNVFWNGIAGESFPDAMIEPTVIQRLEEWTAAGKPNTNVYVGSSDLHTMYRVAVSRGLIARTEIQFWFADAVLPLNDRFMFDEWPAVLGTQRMQWIMELTTFQNAAN